jgi:Putative zinc-finger
VNRVLELALRRHRPDEVALSSWLDGQLDPAASAKLEAHVSACGACRGRTEELRIVRVSLRAMPAAEPPRSFRITREMAAATPAVAAPRPLALRLAPAVSAVAVVVFAVVVGADVYSSGGSSSTSATGALAPSSGAAAQRSNADSGLTAPESGAEPTNVAAAAPVTPLEPAAGGVAPPSEAATPSAPPGPATGAGVAPTTESGEDSAKGIGTSVPAATGPAFESAAHQDQSGSSGNNRTALHVIEAVIAAVALAAGAVAIGTRLRERGASR